MILFIGETTRLYSIHSWNILCI